MPVCEMMMFSTFMSGAESLRLGVNGPKARDKWMRYLLRWTTIAECAAYLLRKISSHAFPEAYMAGDVVERLVTVRGPENHAIIILMNDRLGHVADVGMIEEH